MNNRKVFTFFYGSYINLKVLNEVNIYLDNWEVCRLPSYEIIIKPYANLIESAKDCAYGILARLTHEELKRLYSHAEKVFHELYQPEAVLVHTLNDKWAAALCYICHNMEERPADKNYIERIVEPAKEYGSLYGILKSLKVSRAEFPL